MRREIREIQPQPLDDTRIQLRMKTPKKEKAELSYHRKKEGPMTMRMTLVAKTEATTTPKVRRLVERIGSVTNIDVVEKMDYMLRMQIHRR
jgi:hypothetical protein